MNRSLRCLILTTTATTTSSTSSSSAFIIIKVTCFANPCGRMEQASSICIMKCTIYPPPLCFSKLLAVCVWRQWCNCFLCFVLSFPFFWSELENASPFSFSFFSPYLVRLLSLKDCDTLWLERRRTSTEDNECQLSYWPLLSPPFFFFCPFIY